MTMAIAPSRCAPRSRKASPRRADSPFEGGICPTGGNRCHARPCATGGRSLRDSALPGASGLWRATPVDQRRKLMRTPLVAPLGVLFLLAACSGTAQPEDKTAQAETHPEQTGRATRRETMGQNMWITV